MVSTDSTTEASEDYSSYEEIEKMVHIRSAAPRQARAPVPPPSSSDSECDDDLDALTPPPKTHEKQKKKEKQPQKQKKEQPPPPSLSPSPLPSALLSNKTAATTTSAKHRREDENDGIPEPPSTKKKMTGHTVQHGDEVPAKEKKKVQKHNVAEAVSTPSSPQKSAKKVLQVWNSKDELAFLNDLLRFTKGGKEFPKNMSPVYDYLRNVKDLQYSNKQFRDKLRRLKAKFWSLVENIRVNNYSFRSTDEAAMYKLCKQLWCVQDEGDDGEKTKNWVEEEEETKDGEDQGEEEEGQDEPTRNKTMASPLINCNGADVERISRESYSKLCEERDYMVNEVKNTVVEILKESQTKTRAMVQDFVLNARTDHVQFPYRDKMIGIHSGRRAPVLSRVKTEELEEKWRKQQIAEMEVFSRRLDLLQEECKMCLEGLRASASSGRS